MLVKTLVSVIGLVLTYGLGCEPIEAALGGEKPTPHSQASGQVHGAVRPEKSAMRKATNQTATETLRLALILQRYDPWDRGVAGWFIKHVWRRFLRWGEERYNIRFDLEVLYEDSVISGILEKHRFDIVIGPGGSGTWWAKETFRKQMERYIAEGGSYLGVCGDGAFGTLGFAGLSPRLERVFVKQTARAPRLEPFLGVANVYTDLTPGDKVGNWRIRTLVLRILFSPVRINFPETGSSGLQPSAKQTLKVNWGFMVAVPGDREDMSLVNVDAVYADDWVFPKGSLKGKAAQVSTTYGKGRVILTGLHAEFRKSNYHIVIRNILWLARPGGQSGSFAAVRARPVARGRGVGRSGR